MLPVDHDRAAEASLQLVRERSQILVRRQIAKEDGKFISAQTSHDRFAKYALQMRRDIAEQRVAGGMPQRIVDDLEIIEIDIGNHYLRITAAPGERMLELFDEKLAIGQIGEAVVKRHMRNLAFALFNGGDHRVEAGTKAADLVVRRHFDLRVLAFTQQARRVVERAQRAGDRPRDAPAEDQDQRQAGRGERGEQPLQPRIFVERLAERVTEDESGADALLECRKRGEVMEDTLIIVALDNLFQGCSCHLGGKPRGTQHARIDIDRRELAQSLHLGRVQRLRENEPADRIGHLDR